MDLSGVNTGVVRGFHHPGAARRQPASRHCPAAYAFTHLVAGGTGRRVDHASDLWW